MLEWDSEQMMLFDKNRQPRFHKHKCPKEREGQLMTYEELQSFAIDVLFEEFKICGTENLRRLNSNIDISYTRGGLTINVKVVYQQQFGVGPCIFDDSELIKRYHDAGEIPHLMLASAFCEAIPTGMSAICGTNCCFKFYPINLIPNEKNFILPCELNSLQLANIYAMAWNNLDSSII